MEAAFANCGEGIARALNVHTYGNGTQTIVLSHGYGGDQNVWHYLVPLLACYFRVLVFDMVISPNVDPRLYDPVKYSDFSGYARDLSCVLDEFGVKKSVFVGHSMSALIGCVAAVERPDLFQHLVLLAGSPRYLIDKDYNGGFTLEQVHTLFNSIKHNFSSWVKRFVPSAVLVNDTRAVAQFEGSLGKLKPEIALSAAKTVFLTDNRRVLPHVRVPATIIQSEKDNIVPRSVAFYMKEELGAPAEVRVVKSQGHFLQLTAPLELWCVLKEALGIEG